MITLTKFHSSIKQASFRDLLKLPESYEIIYTAQILTFGESNFFFINPTYFKHLLIFFSLMSPLL
jgi:hypothetical protein